MWLISNNLSKQPKIWHIKLYLYWGDWYSHDTFSFLGEIKTFSMQVMMYSWTISLKHDIARFSIFWIQTEIWIENSSIACHLCGDPSISKLFAPTLCTERMFCLCETPILTHGDNSKKVKVITFRSE